MTCRSYDERRHEHGDKPLPRVQRSEAFSCCCVQLLLVPKPSANAAPMPAMPAMPLMSASLTAITMRRVAPQAAGRGGTT
eukprot:scaffold8345_cov60-Phaeocystis_antarctica.AAC.2